MVEIGIFGLVLGYQDLDVGILMFLLLISGHEIATIKSKKKLTFEAFFHTVVKTSAISSTLVYTAF